MSPSRGMHLGREASVNVDADGFLDIREPIDDEDWDTAKNPITHSDQVVRVAQAVENNGGSGGKTEACDDSGMLANLRELEQREDCHLAVNPVVPGQSPRTASALDHSIGNSDSAEICDDNGMMARLRELERLEELRELEELDELEQTANDQHHNERGGGSCESPLAKLPTASSTPAPHSPADLFRVMQRTEEFAATAVSALSREGTSLPAKHANSEKSGIGSAAEAGMAGGIHERIVDASAALSPPGGSALASGRLPAEEPAPRRISKFKADRARGRQG